MNSRSDLIQPNGASEGNDDLASTTVADEEKSKTCEAEICEDNKANIRIRVSSSDVNLEDEACPEPIKSDNSSDVLGSSQEKRPIKLQRSDAQDDDASIDNDVESVTRDMKKLTPSGHSTSTDDDRKKNLLSSQESGCSNDRGSPCLSRDSSTELYTDSTGIDLEKFITDSLQSKDRIFLLGIEKDVISFVKDEERTSYQFDRMNTYHRMLVHRVAAFFGLDHNVEKTTESVIVTKTKNTRLPELKFDDVQVVRTENEVVSEPKKLLKRSDFSGSSLDKSPDRRDLRGSKNQSYEERHEKYVETRARIFAASHSSGSEDQSNIGDNSLGATANSSQDDVSRGGADKPWSSTESESSGRFKDRNTLYVPPIPVKKSRSLEGPVNAGPASTKVPLQQTKASSWNESSSSRGPVSDATNGRSGEWSRSSNASHHQQQNTRSFNPRNHNWQPRGDGVQSSRNPNHRFRGAHQQPWQAHDPNRVLFVGAHSNPRFKDMAQQPGDRMILHQVANILGQSDQPQMQNPGIFYQQVPAPVQQPKSLLQQRSLCNGAPGNLSGGSACPPSQWQDSSRNNVPANYNQQVFAPMGAASQVPANQLDPRFMYLNSQYSVQSPFGGQNYVLMGGVVQAPVCRAPTANFNPNYPGQSIQPSVMAQGSLSMTYAPQQNQMMAAAKGSSSNGQGLLPLPYPFPNQQVPQNFQPLPHQMPTGHLNPLFKVMNPPLPQNIAQPLVLTNPSPVMSVASGQGPFLPGLIVTNPQMNNHNQHQQNVFYGQMCPTAPTRYRHHTGRGHSNR